MLKKQSRFANLWRSNYGNNNWWRFHRSSVNFWDMFSLFTDIFFTYGSSLCFFNILNCKSSGISFTLGFVIFGKFGFYFFLLSSFLTTHWFVVVFVWFLSVFHFDVFFTILFPDLILLSLTNLKFFKKLSQ